MTIPRVSDIVGIVNILAPFSLAEEWDNAGLQVGDPSSPAGKIMVALDPDLSAVEAAVSGGFGLLLTHHPLIFRPVKKVSATDHVGRLLTLAIRNDLAIVSLHTNFDIADGGMNDLLVELLGLSDCTPLKVTTAGELVKISVFVPMGHEERVMDALTGFCGVIGNYSDCSFRTAGTGTFRPLPGAEPFLGEVGRREYAEEVRLEMLLPRENLDAAVKAMIAAHPYEEPAYDLYPLLNRGNPVGLGRIGTLSGPLPLREFALLVRDRLGSGTVRYVGEGERIVRKVAVCGGSGASLLREAARRGADALVTGDVKYHEAREAEALGISLVDAGHFATERPMIKGLAGLLAVELEKRGYQFRMEEFEGEREPFSYA